MQPNKHKRLQEKGNSMFDETQLLWSREQVYSGKYCFRIWKNVYGNYSAKYLNS